MRQAKDSLVDAGVIPIVLGITGHRDLRDPAAIAALLKREIEGLVGHYPNTPLVAMSALAAGADQLFARVALELQLPLYVSLPLPLDEYLKDFKSDPSAEGEFESLYRQAKGVFTLPQADPVCVREVCVSDYHRQLQYTRLGIFLAQHSHILFALWDGESEHGSGGTAQVVRLHLHGRLQEREDDDPAAVERTCACGKVFKDTLSPLAWINTSEPTDLLGEPDSGMACHILTARTGAPLATGVPSLRWSRRAGRDGTVKADWLPYGSTYPGDALLDKLDDYNAKLAKVNTHVSEHHPCQRLFRRADALAVQNLTHSRRYIALVFALAILTEIVPLGSERFEFTAFFILLLAMYGIVRHLHPRQGIIGIRRSRRGNANEASTDQRVLAEGLRIQAAWSVAGVFDAVALRHQRHDHENLAWVRRALLGAAILATDHQTPEPESEIEAIEHVRNDWVLNQAKWFGDRYQKRLGQGGFWRKLRGTVPALDAVAWILFWLGLAVSFVGLLASWSLLVDLPKWIDGHLALLHGLLPGWAAMVWVFIEFAEYREDAEEYRRAAQLYTHANRRLVMLGEMAQGHHLSHVVRAQRAVLHQLGIEALHENARWAHRHKAHDASIKL